MAPDTGKKNIEELNVVLKETASPWFQKVCNKQGEVAGV